MKGKIMTHVISGRDERTVEAIAEEFVKDHNSTEIVAELVEYSNTVLSLESKLEYERTVRSNLASQLEIVKNFITEHVKDNDDATVSELKELAGELDITLTKEVEVEFTVTYKLTVECELDEEVSDNDFSVSLDYNGVGELTNEEADWSEVIIEDE
jgi:hypothetical protein